MNHFVIYIALMNGIRVPMSDGQPFSASLFGILLHYCLFTVLLRLNATHTASLLAHKRVSDSVR